MGVNRTQPRYRALAEVLQKDLQAGRYPVGSVLPGELELVSRHRVSRHTVREALRCLEEQGLITRNRGIGTVVTALESPPGRVQRLASPAEWMRYPEGSRLVVLATDEVVADDELASSLACKRGTHWCRVRALRRLRGRGGAVIGWSDIYLPKEYAAVAISVGKAGGYVYEAIEKRFGARVETVEVELRAEVLDAVRAKGMGVKAGTPSLALVRRYRGRDGRVFLVTIAEHPAERYTYGFRLRRSRDGTVWLPD